MAGKRMRRAKPLLGTFSDNQRSTEEVVSVEQQQKMWSQLPLDLLEAVMSRLMLKEKICVSAVCKTWYSGAQLIRMFKKSPWIMKFPKHGHIFEFYDPSHRETYFTELPELTGCRVCYTKDNWILLYKPFDHKVLFFNPFTRQEIKMPTFELSNQVVAFSCAPTSPNCIVFTVGHINPTNVAISTCKPGATKWSTINYHNRLPFVSSIWNKLVFSNGVFYCLSLTGWLGVFDPEACTWTVSIVPPPKFPENFYAKNWWKGKFITEHKGEVFVIYTCENENPLIFKFDRTRRIWTETKNLGGVTFFASFLTSYVKSDLFSAMRNSVYFPKVRFYGKRCVSYSVDQGRYFPKIECHDWGEQDPFESIWIEPPEDFTDFIEKN